MAAQLNFLQSQYTNLVVKSTFDEETARIFKQFENNSTMFSEGSVRNIRVAAELSTLTSCNSQARRRTVQRVSARSTSRGFHCGHCRGSGFGGRYFNWRLPVGRSSDYTSQPDTTSYNAN